MTPLIGTKILPVNAKLCSAKSIPHREELTYYPNVDMLLQNGGRMTTMTSREFNQNSSAAKKAALLGPVFITDRGEISHVLLSYAEYSKLSSEKNIVDMLACPESAEYDFEPEKISSPLIKHVDFS